MRVEQKEILAVVGKRFDYSMNFDFIDIVVEVINRALDSDNVTEEPNVTLQEAINDCLIWCDKQWIVMRHYQIPSEANLENASLDLLGDCWYILMALIGDKINA